MRHHSPSVARSLIGLCAAALCAACASPQLRLTNAALMGDDRQVAELLQDKRVDVNASFASPEGSQQCSASQLTPLQAAVCRGRLDTVKLLLEHNAKPDAPSAGVRALVMAIERDEISIAKLLLERDADANAKDESGRSALLLAVRKANQGLIKLLLERGADANAKDENGQSALMLAAKKGSVSLVKLLLSHGADIAAQDNHGDTAFMLAASVEAAKLVGADAADVNAQDSDGDTALLIAARRGNAAMAHYLLQRGADVSAKDAQGLSTLALARRSQSADTVEALQAALRRIFDKDLSTAEAAAQNGETGRALSLYASALAAASEDPVLVRQIRVLMIRCAARSVNHPNLPEDARRHVVQGQYLLKQGMSPDEVEKEMRLAIDAAPWWGDGYYNLGMVQATADHYQDAMATLKLFVEADPKNSLAAAAQDKIYELEIAQREADKISGLAGSWSGGWSVSVSGNKLTASGGSATLTATIRKNMLDGSVEGGASAGGDNCTIPGQIHPATGKIDADGRGIEFDYVWSQYQTHGHCVDMFGNASWCCLLCTTVCDGVNIIATNNVHMRLTR